MCSVCVLSEKASAENFMRFFFLSSISRVFLPGKKKMMKMEEEEKKGKYIVNQKQKLI